MKISILIPVYNEAPTLAELLRRVQIARLPSGCTREIIVINDGSTDSTASVLLGLNGATVLHHDTNKGKSTAIRTGFANASGDVVVIQDGDLEYDPNDYQALLTPILEGNSDVVYGSRFLGSAANMTRRSRLANKFLTGTANVLYGANLSDVATGYKAFRADVFRRLALQSQRFEFCVEVTAKLLRCGVQIHEVPIRYKARTVNAGKKIRAIDGLKAWWTLARLRFVRCEAVSLRGPKGIHAEVATQTSDKAA